MTVPVEWNRIFLDHFDHERGWANDASREEFSAAAPDLLERLQSHFGPEVHVVAGLWPLGP